jgi:hypothetical protein
MVPYYDPDILKMYIKIRRLYIISENTKNDRL